MDDDACWWKVRVGRMVRGLNELHVVLLNVVWVQGSVQAGV